MNNKKHENLLRLIFAVILPIFIVVYGFGISVTGASFVYFLPFAGVIFLYIMLFTYSTFMQHDIYYPDPRDHMFTWLIWGGVLIGILYSLLLTGIGQPLEILLTETTIFNLTIGFAIAIFSGIVLGTISWMLLAHHTTFTYEDTSIVDVQLHNMKKLYVKMFAIPVILGAFTAIPAYSFFDFLNIAVATEVIVMQIVLIPAVLAGILMTYATFRYPLRITRWKNHLNTRKSKAKNDDYHRLIDDEEITDYTVHDSQTSIQESQA